MRQEANKQAGFRLILLGLLAWLPWASAQDLVVNAEVPVDALSRNEARLYLTMRLRNWPDGTAVHLFVLPDDHPLHERVANQVLGLYPYQLRRVWDRLVFSGTGQAPVTVQTPLELLERVAATPGALGYAQAATLPGDVRPIEVR